MVNAKHPRKSWIFPVVLVSIALALLLCEIGLRIFYKPFDADRMEEQFASYSYSPPINALGFRQADPPANVFDEDHARVLFLGDSFTFGHGVVDGRNRFSAILEDRLNRESPTGGPKFHIYNAGTEGSNPGAWLDSLRTLLPVYRPKTVFAVFFLRDGAGLGTSFVYYKHVFQAFAVDYEKRFWYRHFYVGKLAADVLVRKRFSEYYVRLMKAPYLGRKRDRAFWIQQQRFLEAIRDECRRNGADFHLVIFPLLFGLESHYQFRDVEDAIARFADGAGIPVFSLTPGFLGQKSRSLWISSLDQHPNEKGNRIAADTLFPYLKKTLFSLH